MRTEMLKGKSVVFTGRLSCLSRKDAQKIVQNHGGITPRTVTRHVDFLVVGEEGYLQAIEKSIKLKKAEAINLKGGHIQIVPESTFLRTLGLKSKEELKRSLYGGRDIIRRFGLNKAHLRYLERWGLIRPFHRTNADTYYDFRDLLTIRRVSQSLEKGIRLSYITKVLNKELVGGQISFRFKPTEPPQVVKLTSDEVAAESAEDWFENGFELEQDPDRIDQAIAAYARALDIEPRFTDALINLGNLLYEKGDIEKARLSYEKVLEIDPRCCLAHFNLGNICDDLGDYRNALRHFKKAVEFNSDYADTHFNMAIVYEKMGLANMAKRHWREYLRIDPEGDWAKLVKEHLGLIRS